MTPSPSWKSAEQLVAHIEKALAPDATVEHNVQLPVLGQSRSRQCDVVIRIGKPPREQVFIVEVQQRGSKPDINTFGGWLRKMDEVGANGLICVSEAGFPDSIIQDVATRVGPKVKLVTLNESAPEAVWADLHLIPTYVESSYDVQFERIDRPVFWDADFAGPIRFNVGSRILSNTDNANDALTLGAAMNQAIIAKDPHQELPPEAVGQVVEVNFTLNASDEKPLWLHADNGLFRLRSWSFLLYVRRVDRTKAIAFSKWSYSQQFHGSALAWVASASIELNGVLTSLNLVFVPDEHGILRASLAVRPDAGR